MSSNNGYSWRNENGAWIYGPAEGNYLISIELMVGQGDKYSVHIEEYDVDVGSLYRKAFCRDEVLGLIGDVLTGLTLKEVGILLVAYSTHVRQIPIPDNFNIVDARVENLPLAV